MSDAKSELLEVKDPTQMMLFENLAPHSCEISMNAKGEFSFSVKVYSADPAEAKRRAVELARELEGELRGAKEGDEK